MILIVSQNIEKQIIILKRNHKVYIFYQESIKEIKENIVEKIKNEDKRDWDDNISKKSKNDKMEDKIAK